MITVSRKDQDTWVLHAEDLVQEVSREDLRQFGALFRNAARLPIPPPPDPPPVVVEVPVLPDPPDALALAISGLGVPAVLATLFTGMTAPQVQQLVKDYLPGGKP